MIYVLFFIFKLIRFRFLSPLILLFVHQCLIISRFFWLMIFLCQYPWLFLPWRVLSLPSAFYLPLSILSLLSALFALRNFFVLKFRSFTLWVFSLEYFFVPRLRPTLLWPALFFIPLFPLPFPLGWSFFLWPVWCCTLSF